jgi:hypothetical protein
MFGNFIKYLLEHCGRWAALKSILIIENVSFHSRESIRELSLNACVKLLYLLPYLHT